MSQENVEIVRRTIEAYISGDNEAALAAFDPAVALDWKALRPDGRVFRGSGGVAEAMRDWSGTFEDWRMEIEEIVDAGDCVFVETHDVGRGKGSGIPIEQTAYQVVTLRKRQDHSLAGISAPRSGPRSRRAAGVGPLAHAGRAPNNCRFKRPGVGKPPHGEAALLERSDRN
jgi:ketosteroid isomerase-like protein